MTQSNWFWLFLGLIGALPISMIANIYTPQVMSFLEKRRLVIAHRSRQRTFHLYNRVKEFHDGKRDRYAYYIICSTFAIIFMIMASSLILVVLAVKEAQPEILKHIGAAIFFFFTITAMIFLFMMWNLVTRLDKFEEFKAGIERRLGEHLQ